MNLSSGLFLRSLTPKRTIHPPFLWVAGPSYSYDGLRDVKLPRDGSTDNRYQAIMSAPLGDYQKCLALGNTDLLVANLPSGALHYTKLKEQQSKLNL